MRLMKSIMIALILILLFSNIKQISWAQEVPITAISVAQKFQNLYSKAKEQKLLDRLSIDLFDPQFDKIIIAQSKGTKLKVLTNEGHSIATFDLSEIGSAVTSHLKWSPKGNKFICPIKIKKSPIISLYLLDLNGVIIKVKEANIREQILQPSWTRDGEWVVFIKSKFKQGSGVWAKNVNTYEEIKITETNSGNPQWFNETNLILYKEIIQMPRGVNEYNLWIFDCVNHKRSKIYQGEIYNTYPSIASNDSLIIVTDSKFKIIDRMGNNIVELPERGIDPVWAPNGDKIAYLKGTVEGDPGILKRQHIYVINIVDKKVTNVTPNVKSIIKSFRWIDNETLMY